MSFSVQRDRILDFLKVANNLNTKSITTDGLVVKEPVNPLVSGDDIPIDTLHSEIDSGSDWSQPYQSFYLPIAPAGTIKFLSLSNDRSAPVKITTDTGCFVLSGSDTVGLIFSGTTRTWKDYMCKNQWFVTSQQTTTPLTGTGNTGVAQQGRSVSLSADGNTLAVGGPGNDRDFTNQGAVWIWVRNISTGAWTQQTLTPLIGTDSVSNTQQGYSVSLSTDGNTLAVGGLFNNSGQGAVWIWIRTAGTSVWSQQGAKLVGTGNTGAAQQGTSVSLSSDGNTLAVGGMTDTSGQGAVWVWIRNISTGEWTQQTVTPLYVVSAGALQGSSVSLSADGNTLAIGGPNDSSSGAVWIWIRSAAGVWTQQGVKLVGTGNTGNANQGTSVSLSADGNTLAVGGISNDSSIGAVWIWTRASNVWTQTPGLLIGTGNNGNSIQGRTVSLSADGNTLAVGGNGDTSSQGAVWIWTRSSTGASAWTQQGSKLVGTGGTSSSQQGFSISLSANGTTLASSGYLNASSEGTVWVFI